jgi:hypothetical protein
MGWQMKHVRINFYCNRQIFLYTQWLSAVPRKGREGWDAGAGGFYAKEIPFTISRI